MDEWKNWKSVNYPYIKLDPHHMEIIDIRTGEVLEENVPKSVWDELEDYEVNFCKSRKNYYRTLRIYRGDIGDAFCSTDWSKH